MRTNFFFQLLLSFTLTSVTANATQCQENTLAETVKSFESAPVFYNGRITTHAKVAKALLFRITGDNEFRLKHPESDKSVSASLWLLDIISGHKRYRSFEIFPVKDPIRKLIQPVHKSDHASFEQLAKIREKIVNEIKKQNKPSVKEIEVDGVKIVKSAVGSTLQTLELVEEIHFFHQLKSDPNQMAELAISSMRFPIPLYAPPPGEGFEWETFAFANVFDQVKKTNRKDIAFLKQILSAHRDNKLKELAEAVTKYTSIVRLKDFSSPLTFRTPDGWKEINNPRGMNLEYFNDFNGHGIPIASFHCGPEFKCMGGLACVIEATGSMVRSVNNERYIAGQLPLAEEELSKKLERVKIAGEDGFRFVHENQTSEWGDNKSIQIGFKKGDLTWATSIYGPRQAVDSESKNFEAFCESLIIQNSFFEKMMKRRKRNPNQVQNKLTVFVCNRKDRTLVLRLHEMRKRLPENRNGILELLKSIPPDNKPIQSSKDLAWQMPDGWKVDETGTIVVGDFTAYVICDVLKGKADGQTQKRIADLLCGLGGKYQLDGKSDSVNAGELKTQIWQLEPAN